VRLGFERDIHCSLQKSNGIEHGVIHRPIVDVLSNQCINAAKEMSKLPC
jgi:hypothetical protein